MNEPLIAYVSGDTPPDLAAIAAFGFDIVCLDTRAPWFNESVVAKAQENGLTTIAFRMGYVAAADATSRRPRRSLGST
jgi:hypothetical protein